MNKTTTLRVKRGGRSGGPGNRSGRYSAQLAYSGAKRRTDAEELEESGSGPHLRLLPRIDKDQDGLASEYSLRLGPGAIARVRLERKGPDHAWIDWVFVPPAHRGDGTGRKLLEQVLADADALGTRLSLEARACAGLDQAKLEAWYRGFGFVPNGRRGPFGPILVRPARARTSIRVLRRAA